MKQEYCYISWLTRFAQPSCVTSYHFLQYFILLFTGTIYPIGLYRNKRVCATAAIFTRPAKQDEKPSIPPSLVGGSSVLAMHRQYSTVIGGDIHTDEDSVFMRAPSRHFKVDDKLL